MEASLKKAAYREIAENIISFFPRVLFLVALAGVLSVDVLSVGGLTTKATFGEMTTRSMDGCKTVDGVMGMGLSKSGDSQNAFETLVDVSASAQHARMILVLFASTPPSLSD